RHDGNGSCQANRHRENPVSQGRGPLPDEELAGEREQKHGGHFQHGRPNERHRPPSFRALSTSAAIRFSCSSVRWLSPPSRASTTFSVEPSKKVSIRCRSAERRTAPRGTTGMYT